MVTEEDASQLRNLRKVYCLLVEMGKAVNAAYGVQNLVEVVSCFVSTVTYIYISIVVYLDLKPVWPGIPRGQVIIMFSLWIGLMVGRLLTTAYSSDMVVQETSRTQRLVQKLLLLPLPARSGCQDELQLFGEQMARSRLRYSAAGFFTLDLSLLRSFTATVTTYVVILVQFGLSDASKQQNSSAAGCKC
ncbi:putative gustatory receptor 28b [Schistocerca piceifrons]|uniref:putative gustatory receptor 28b n=1 Tax=Schistocerca piceifrons TaxID=274613 RepID=UPI001F5FE471|nr:putative gustatory receptor 28b [Schistocerca piceifrons]